MMHHDEVGCRIVDLLSWIEEGRVRINCDEPERTMTAFAGIQSYARDEEGVVRPTFGVAFWDTTPEEYEANAKGKAGLNVAELGARVAVYSDTSARLEELVAALQIGIKALKGMGR